ncbi:MAG: T9SS type A sorting domain-containing protein, partial [Bacteroidia bacterium]|nr:T9SS type A sorting domain-containing protein [Bacteroidia bacterium]
WEIQGTGSKIVLGTGSSINFTIPAANTVTGTIDLASNSTLTINSETVPTIGSKASSSSIVFNNANPQAIPAGTYNNLTITGGGTKSIAGSITINGTLTFTSGKLQLGTYDLTIGSSGSISGANSTNYIVTNSTGVVIMQVSNSATNITYPVGTSTSYNPVVLSQTAAGTTDNFEVRVFSGVSTSYNASDAATGTAITSDVVTKTWAISESTVGGSNMNITLQWNAADEGTSFSRSTCYVAHYTGGAWQSIASGAASGTGPYTRQLTGVTSFSPFTIIDNSSPLPVRMLSFSGKPGDAGNELEWITASEVNNKGFEIERRDELTGDFVFVGFVNGHGTTSMVNTYIYNDDVTSSAYYRLKQVDFDGRFEYSQIIYIDRSNVNSTFSNGNVSINIYPNPAVNSVSVEVAEGADWELNVKLVDINGKEINVPVQEKSADGRKLTLDVSAVRKGVYFIESVNGQNKLSQKLLIL